MADDSLSSVQADRVLWQGLLREIIGLSGFPTVAEDVRDAVRNLAEDTTLDDAGYVDRAEQLTHRDLQLEILVMSLDVPPTGQRGHLAQSGASRMPDIVYWRCPRAGCPVTGEPGDADGPFGSPTCATHTLTLVPGT
ncbi:hypothetical protein AB0A95_13360 [Micromonospora sp. NPDC049230]|uniref:hypothetical protein n=1 Tax=Micromonospora sp. NPDC049230 TaxID=3155502 RepID=UPI0033E3E101